MMTTPDESDVSPRPFSDLWRPLRHQAEEPGHRRKRPKLSLGMRLLSSLGTSSRWHSRETLRYFTSDNDDEMLHAATSVGMASELLLKLFIGRTSPALLADKGNVDALLMLAGHPAAADMPLSKFRSIGAGQALALAKKMGLATPGHAGDFAPFVVRNSAAHLAAVDMDELTQAVELHATLAKGLFDHLNIDPKSFWGEENWATVEQLIEDKYNKDWTRYTAKLTAAKHRFEALSETLGPKVLAALRATKTTRTMIGFSSGTDESVAFDCPACGSVGQIIYHIQDEGSIHYEDGGAWMDQFAEPVYFECPICELELEQDEVYRIPGAEDYIPDSREMENEELHQLEHDEDMWRDR